MYEINIETMDRDNYIRRAAEILQKYGTACVTVGEASAHIDYFRGSFEEAVAVVKNTIQELESM